MLTEFKAFGYRRFSGILLMTSASEGEVVISIGGLIIDMISYVKSLFKLPFGSCIKIANISDNVITSVLIDWCDVSGG
ncbi:MAG: hypothetical protein ACTS4X_00530 [Candidatus Hodgkinia cicadicola]